MANTQKCLNCGKTLPQSAKYCPYCEAPVEEPPSEEERAFILKMMAEMDPQTRQELKEAFDSSESAEELIKNIFVGSCPKCESSNTGDCDTDPEIENPLVGRCLDCGHHWCTECGRSLNLNKLECPCWDEEIPELLDL